MVEYQKEINKQLSHVRIEHRLHSERETELSKYSSSVENELMQAKVRQV